MIARKKKHCIACGNERFIYAKKMCSFCYATEQSKRAKEKLRKDKSVGISKSDLFNEIWSEREHRSEIDGSQLLPKGHKLWHCQFSHILPHGLYARFEYDKRNIILKTVEQHQLWQFHVDRIKDKEEWKWVFDLRDSLKEEYNNG